MRDRVDARYEMIYAPYAEWFRVHAFPDGDGLSLFFSNITSEKTLEDQLNEERLLREKRIEALSHMAGGLAHEISNPLAIIYARASDLKASAQERPVIEAEEVLKACESIVQTSDRAIKILRGLKGFAREAAKDPMEWASIYDIVEQCVDLQAARFERHRIDLRTNLAPALPLLLCRETQVGQIVTNLLNNAFDAIDQHDCTVRWVEVSAVAAGEMLELEVVDSGPGIDEQARAHLMEPFFTTKPRGLGLGVGLSLSRAIAQEHNGSLILCDDLSHTRFRLRLPFDPDTAANPQAVAGGVYQA
jgi:signal transduction histidine kinase